MTAKVARGGALMDKPRWVRILAITVGWSMAAMIFEVPPYWGHCSISIANTRMPPGPENAGRHRGMGRVTVIVCGVIRLVSGFPRDRRFQLLLAHGVLLSERAHAGELLT
jgi:hypothetical protein